MLFPSALVIFSLVITVGKCQFLYNYEEADDTAQNVPSPIRQENKRSHETPRTEDFQEHQSPRTEVIKESRSPRIDVTEEVRTPRRRQYRRILREGYYVQPPTTQTPKIYGPSVFENIELGQAPSGVYIPQDSFLNVLRNPSRRTDVSYNVPAYSSNYVSPNYFQNNARQPTFFVAPPEEQRRPESVIPSVVEPNVQYAAPSPMSADNGNYEVDEEIPARPRTRSNKPVRQRQHQARIAEPVVDIDVLRTPPDMMRDITPIPIQIRPRNQGRRASQNRQRQAPRIQYDSDPIPPPRVYSPSVFQNVGLGEAPKGVEIPSDSLLNVLRNPSSHSPSPRTVPDKPQVSLQPQDTNEQDYVQPKRSPIDSRRQSRQRSRNPNTERRAEYQYEDNIQDSVQSVPVSSQQQRRHHNRNNNPVPSRRYASTPSENRSSRRQQQVQVQPQETKVTSTDRGQRKFKAAKLAIAALPEDTDDDGIPGEAGVDYPTLHTIPRTPFSCREQPHNGYYADLETSCQVVHLCQARGVQSSFLCPNGTIFSQEKFSCQWWYKVNCADSPKFYSINDNLYKVPEDKTRKRT